MAMIDYGAIAWKDGKLISKDMFTNMVDMVGWTDDGYLGLEDEYFAYVGDEDLTLAFYKNLMRVYRKDYPYRQYDTDNEGKETIFFGFENFNKWKYWHDWFYVSGDEVDIKVYPRKFHNYYVCKMSYRGHKYKVAFGYGVDLGYYKKTHIIDYFGTPWYKLKRIWFNFKHIHLYDFLYDIKLRLKRRWNKGGKS